MSLQEVQAEKNKEGQWRLVHPRCALERQDDLVEVEDMLEAGEFEIARDELRWLLQGCPENLEIHFRLGEIALAEHDTVLARGHYGYAYQIGFKALKRHGFPTPLPESIEANQLFFAAGRQLAWCLKLLDKPKLMREVLDLLLHCDPSDPLKLKEW